MNTHATYRTSSMESVRLTRSETFVFYSADSAFHCEMKRAESRSRKVKSVLVCRAVRLLCFSFFNVVNNVAYDCTIDIKILLILVQHNKNKNPLLGNAIPVLGMKLKRSIANFGYFST